MTEKAKLSARELTLAAKETITDLTGHRAESVTAMEWDDELWRITVDVCELERVPNTTDVMAAYVVQLDDEGQLRGYKREHRFLRGSAEDGRR